MICGGGRIIIAFLFTQKGTLTGTWETEFEYKQMKHVSKQMLYMKISQKDISKGISCLRK